MRYFFKNIYLLFIYMMILPLHSYAQGAQEGICLDVVVLDPGHGGKDPGALGIGSAENIPEKEVVLSIAKILGKKIEEGCPGVKVCYTRKDDTFIGLSERAKIAKRNNADLFISIHCNAHSNKSAFGTSVHILGQRSDNASNKRDYFARSQSVAQRENDVIVLEDNYQVKYAHLDPNLPESYIGNLLQWKAYYESSLLFATEVIDHLIAEPLTPRNIVLDQDVFTVLAEARMPAVLLELAFISNANEYAYLTSAEGQEEIAERLYQAFVSYKSKYDSSLSFTAPVDLPVPAPVQTPAQPVAEETPAEDTVYYSVQIMTVSRNIQSGDPVFKGLDVHGISITDRGLYKYMVGKYPTKKEAASSLADIKEIFPDAFVVKVKNGEVSRP